jgi:DNA-directed RNA polymerase specialized sigma54-like protein
VVVGQNEKIHVQWQLHLQVSNSIRIRMLNWFYFHLGTGEFLMKSLFSKSISDACAIDDLTPETIRNHINNIFLSKIFNFYIE